MYKLITNNNLRVLCAQNKLNLFTIFRTKSSNLDPIFNKNVSFIEKSERVFHKDDTQQNPKIGFAAQLLNRTPASIQPYLKIMRIDRPIGSWLLFWPCGWSIGLAAAPGSLPDPYLLTLFAAGSLVMRGAGCTINDLWDRDIDSKVARTAKRPLVNGSMSIRQAWIFLAAQLSVGLAILLQLNWYSIILGASSLGLVAIYPVMKRITYWPQFMLGMTFNWGILLGYSAVHGFIDWAVCTPMYISAVCWTIIYDTIYAHQDIADDLVHGIKSTAIKFKENTKYWLIGFSFVMISGLTGGGIMAEQTWPYYSAVGLAATHLLWQIYSLNITSPQDCANKFISNHHLGFILFLGIVVGNIFKNKNQSRKQ